MKASEQSAINDDSVEEGPDWRRFWCSNPSADDPHEFGECMEDWHDYEWKKEKEEIDRRREAEEWERWIDD